MLFTHYLVIRVALRRTCTQTAHTSMQSCKLVFTTTYTRVLGLVRWSLWMQPQLLRPAGISSARPAAGSMPRQTRCNRWWQLTICYFSVTLFGVVFIAAAGCDNVDTVPELTGLASPRRNITLLSVTTAEKSRKGNSLQRITSTSSELWSSGRGFDSRSVTTLGRVTVCGQVNYLST